MLLSARIIKNLRDVNTFDYDTDYRFVSGNPGVVTFQLIDVDKDRARDGYHPPGRRYVPANDAELIVTIKSIDNDRTIERNAVQPYPNQDPSIWQLPIASTDNILGTCTLFLALTQNGETIRGVANKVLVAYPKDGAY